MPHLLVFEVTNVNVRQDVCAQHCSIILLVPLLLLMQDALDACNGWEVDRQVEQAMDALR